MGALELAQGTAGKRISEPREETGLFDGVHVFGAEPPSLHEQNLDETIDDEIAARSIGERRSSLSGA